MVPAKHLPITMIAMTLANHTCSPFAPMKRTSRQRTSLRYQDSPEPPFTPATNAQARQVPSRRRPAEVTTSRSGSKITSLKSIEDYNKYVLEQPDALHIIRFSAPWCQMCKSTDVAWERMAAKLALKHGSIRFYSVTVDDRDDDVIALKNSLQIDKVPQGIIRHPTFQQQRIDMHRKNLSALRKSLDGLAEDFSFFVELSDKGIMNFFSVSDRHAQSCRRMN